MIGSMEASVSVPPKRSCKNGIVSERSASAVETAISMADVTSLRVFCFVMWFLLT